MPRAKKTKPSRVVQVIEKLGSITLANYECIFESKKEVEEYISAVVAGCGGKPTKEPSIKPTLESLINPKQHKQLCSRIPMLPSPVLLKRARTPDCKQVWKNMNCYNKLLSKCLAVRLLRQDGDPIRHILINGNKEDKLIYQVIWSHAEYLESLLTLIQFGWLPISTQLKNYGFIAECGFQVFLSIIVKNFDSSFIEYLEKDFKISHRHYENLMGAEAKLLYREQASLSKEEKMAWESDDHERDLVMDLIIASCYEEAIATNNKILCSRILDLRKKHGMYSDSWHLLERYRRKNGEESFVWENQTRLRM